MPCSARAPAVAHAGSPGRTYPPTHPPTPISEGALVWDRGTPPPPPFWGWEIKKKLELEELEGFGKARGREESNHCLQQGILTE